MKCKKCGMRLPNDSEFCQYCGQPIKEKADDNEAIIAEPIIEQLPVSNEPAEPPIESDDIKSTSNEAVAVVEESQKKRRYHKERKEKPTVFCKKCGNPLDPSTKKCSSCGAQPFFRKHRSLMPIVALSIVAAILLGLCISLFILSNTKDEKITDLESKVRSLESQARINNNTMDRLRDNNETLQENSDIFDSLCNYGSFGSFGYAANNFHTNTGLVVMTENSTKSFTLTANWSNGGTVDWDYSGTSALITLDNDSWYTSTTATIHAFSKGVTKVTFTNDVDSKTFSMIIIVK